jgi:hypothetical protein
MFDCRLVACSALQIKTKAGIGHEIAVINQAWAAWLMRFVADFGSLLVVEDRLYRRVDIQIPGLAKDRLHAGE